MRTFAFACAVAVVMARRSKKEEEPKEEPKEEIPEEVAEEIVEPAPTHSTFLEKVTKFDFYAKAIW